VARNTPDIVKAPLRLLTEERSATNKTHQSPAEDVKQQEKTEEIKKITNNSELEQPPQLKAYIKYPKYDFF